jgi:AcrR family transcriptional regulator
MSAPFDSAFPQDDRIRPRLSIPGFAQEELAARLRKRIVDAQILKCNSRYIDTRTELLQKCLRYFLAHGVAHLSLRPLAAAVGTSARMLLHYFGSKEALIAEVMELVQDRLQSTFQQLLDRAGTDVSETFLVDFWNALAATANRPSLRLLFEVQMLALQNPKRYRRYLTRTSASWRKLIELVLPRKGNGPATATLYNAVVDGLLLELLATGDLGRTSRALRIFIDRSQAVLPTRRKAGK